MRITVLEAFEPDYLGVVVGDLHSAAARVAVRPGRPGVQTEHEVLTYREPGKYRPLLRDQDAFGVGLRARHPIDDHRSRIRAYEPGHHVHERGLSAAGGSYDSHELAVSYREAHIIAARQRSLVGEKTLFEPADLDLSAHRATGSNGLHPTVFFFFFFF